MTESPITINIEHGLRLRAEGKLLEDQAKQKKADGNVLLQGVFDTMEGDKLSVESPVGKAALTYTTRTSCDMEAFVLLMVNAGVDADTIAAARAAATSQKTSGSIRFTVAKAPE